MPWIWSSDWEIKTVFVNIKSARQWKYNLHSCLINVWVVAQNKCKYLRIVDRMQLLWQQTCFRSISKSDRGHKRKWRSSTHGRILLNDCGMAWHRFHILPRNCCWCWPSAECWVFLWWNSQRNSFLCENNRVSFCLRSHSAIACELCKRIDLYRSEINAVLNMRFRYLFWMRKPIDSH